MKKKSYVSKMQKFVSFLCAAVMIASLLAGFVGVQAAYDPGEDYLDYTGMVGEVNANPINGYGQEALAGIYLFLTEEMELNTAAATGVIAAIYMNVGPDFNPTIETDDSVRAYGLFLWSGHHRELMQYWVASINRSYNNCHSQMLYWGHDMRVFYQDILGQLYMVNDSAAGAMKAAYLVSNYYMHELPRGIEMTVAVAYSIYPTMVFAKTIAAGF